MALLDLATHTGRNQTSAEIKLRLAGLRILCGQIVARKTLEFERKVCRVTLSLEFYLSGLRDAAKSIISANGAESADDGLHDKKESLQSLHLTLAAANALVLAIRVASARQKNIVEAEKKLQLPSQALVTNAKLYTKSQSSVEFSDYTLETECWFVETQNLLASMVTFLF